MSLRPIFQSFEIIGFTKILLDYICVCGLDFRVLKLLVLQRFHSIISVPSAYIWKFWNYWFYKTFILLYLCLRPRCCIHLDFLAWKCGSKSDKPFLSFECFLMIQDFTLKLGKAGIFNNSSMPDLKQTKLLAFLQNFE